MSRNRTPFQDQLQDMRRTREARPGTVPASHIFRYTRPAPAEIPAEAQRPGPPAGQAAPAAQFDDQDLARKLAWAVGSSLSIPYGRKTAVHRYMEDHADELLRAMGLRG